ncbi:MAG: sugar phosphate isomerase/epimerase [Oscillospiraceae bacterium]|nr:sugar phosphate isomerase/epimerase [Oscillospiraceae bacterium]
MKVAEKLTPALLVSESFFPLLVDEPRLIRTLEQVLESGFYTRLEISAMKTPEGQQGLRRLAERFDLKVTQWITNDLNENSLNPSAVDAALRRRTIAKMKELVEIAAASGADRIAFISCKDPGPALRGEAAKGLTEVMCTVADAAQTAGGLTLLLEPLDRGAHKDNFIGPTDEAVEILKTVHQTNPNVLLSWDSAHVALNREDVVESLTLALPYIGQIHLANAVLDRDDPLFGDWHMAMGEPGFLTQDVAYAIANRAAGWLPEGKRLGITIESRSHTEDVMLENEAKNRAFLSAVLNREVI